MVNNCKRRPHRRYHNDQHTRQCNRFMAKVHLDNNIALIVLFVSVFLFNYHPVLADVTHSAIDEDPVAVSGVQIPGEKTQLLENLQLKTIDDNNTTNIELNNKNTGFIVADVVSTHPHHDVHEQLPYDEEVSTSIPLIIKEEYLNNDKFTNIEEKAENLYKNDMLLQFANEEKPEPEPIPEVRIESMENISKLVESSEINTVNPRDGRNLQIEPSKTINHQYLKDLDTSSTSSSNAMEAENSGVISNVADPEQQTESLEAVNSSLTFSSENSFDDFKNKDLIENLDSYSTSSSNSMEAENSGVFSNVADPEQQTESLEAVNSSLTISSENNSSENSFDNFKKKDLIENITNFEEEDLLIPKTSYELKSKVNSTSSYLSIFSADETNDIALSVVLNETFSTSESFSEEENPIRMEENVELTTEEQEEEEERITVLPEGSEHNVVKKVLDAKGIFDDISKTTEIPLLQQAQNTKIQSNAVDEPSSVRNNEEDTLVKTKVYDDQNQELNSKVDDREEKLVYEDQKQEHSSKEEDREAKLLHESQIPELNKGNVNEQLVKPKVKSSHNDKLSISLNNTNHNYSTHEQQAQHQSYSENEQEETKLQPKTESKSLHLHLKLVEHTENPLNSKNKSPHDKAATFFETYLPRDAGQTFNNNLADEYAGVGNALPISISDGSNRSTIIVILSSGTALLFVVISLTIFLISFQRQNGTLDIEMQERNCGKDDLDEEDVETFSKLLAVELPPSVALALDDTEECL